MAERLVFPDPYAAADMLTFAGRAARAGDGAVHLRAHGGLLATSAAPLVRQGLLDATPTIIGLRALPVDPEIECDLVVEAASLQPLAGDPSAVLLPETAIEPPLWASARLPRAGWTGTDGIETELLRERAQWGMSAVARALPIDPGDDVVRAVRGRVWGEPDDVLRGLPRGVAFAAVTLGFLASDHAERATVRAQGRWRRISLPRGHVLWRGPAHTGMTAVRATGASHR